MPDEFPKWIPLTWALIDICVCVALLFIWQPHTYGFWWFARGAIFTLFAAMAIDSLKKFRRSRKTNSR